MKDSIAKEIEAMIIVSSKKMVQDDLKYKEKYEYLECMLLDMIQEAENLKEDMDKNNLTFSGVEAEGYMRFALNVKHLLED